MKPRRRPASTRRKALLGAVVLLLALGAIVAKSRRHARRPAPVELASILQGPEGDTGYGSSIASIPGPGLNGRAALAVGVPLMDEAYLYPGGGTALGGSPLILKPPRGGGDGFGRSLAGASNPENGGFGTLVVGAWESESVYVYRLTGDGRVNAPSAILKGSGGKFGWSVACVEGLRPGKLGAVVVGAPGINRAYVYFADASGLDPDPRVLNGPSGSRGFGWCVAGADGLGGVGRGAVVVGAPGSCTAYMYRCGPKGFEGKPTALVGPQGSAFGAAVAWLPGGFWKFAVGAWAADAVYLYATDDAGPSLRSSLLRGPAHSDFGVSVAGITDPDGFVDLAVGATVGDGVYVYPGGAQGLGSMPLFLAGPDQPMYDNDFGTCVAGAVGNGNGLAVGANGGNRVYLYRLSVPSLP